MVVHEGYGRPEAEGHAGEVGRVQVVAPHVGDQEGGGHQEQGAQEGGPGGGAQAPGEVQGGHAGQEPEEEVDGGEDQ